MTFEYRYSDRSLAQLYFFQSNLINAIRIKLAEKKYLWPEEKNFTCYLHV